MISLIQALHTLPTYVQDALSMSFSFRLLKDELDLFQLPDFAMFSDTCEIMVFNILQPPAPIAYSIFLVTQFFKQFLTEIFFKTSKTKTLLGYYEFCLVL